MHSIFYRFFLIVLLSGWGLQLSAQQQDLPPLVQPDVDRLISRTDSLRYNWLPEVYHQKYLLLDQLDAVPIPFLPDVFTDLVTWPDSGNLNVPYGKFRLHSCSLYDYGGVHFTQVHLAPFKETPTDSLPSIELLEDEMVTLTLGYSFGHAWLRFDEEAESDNWLEVFVEKGMKGFGPELAGIRENSPGASYLAMYQELLQLLSDQN